MSDAPGTEPLRTETAIDWRRPHPLTLLGEIVGSFPAVFAIVLFIRLGADDASGMDTLVDLLFIAGPVITGSARYFTTRFAVTDDAVHLERGLIIRRKQVMPRANIQNVSSKATIVSRVFGLAEVKVSDASSGAEIAIRFVDAAGAAELVEALRPRAAAPPPDPYPYPAFTGTAAESSPAEVSQGPFAPVPVAPEVSDERVLKVASNSDLIRSEGARLITFIGGIAPFASVVLAILLARGTLSVGDIAGMAGLIGVGALVLLSQAVSTFFGLSGFVLSADANGLRTRQGAFTEVRHNASRRRIQMVRVHEDLLLRVQNLERVSYDTADVRTEAGSTSYLSPAGPRGEWRRLVGEALDPAAAIEPDLTSVDRLTVRRTWIRWSVVGLPLLAALPWYPLLALALVAWVAAGYLFSLSRWQMLGYHFGDTYLHARTGVIFHTLWIIRADKIQAVAMTSTFFQRRLGLASIRIGCAGRVGALVIPDMAQADARQLLEQMSVRSAATPVGATI